MPSCFGRATYQPILLFIVVPEPSGGRKSSLSVAYRCMALPHCERLFKQTILRVFAFALFKAGMINASRIAMIAIVTSNSIRLNATNP